MAPSSQGVPDRTLTRTGTAGADGTTLSVVVPALARSGAVIQSFAYNASGAWPGLRNWR